MVSQSQSIGRFSFRFGSSACFAVICPVRLGLAWVSPKPDLPLPSLGFARDIKLSLPLEFNSQFECRQKFGGLFRKRFSIDIRLLDGRMPLNTT